MKKRWRYCDRIDALVCFALIINAVISGAACRNVIKLVLPLPKHELVTIPRDMLFRSVEDVMIFGPSIDKELRSPLKHLHDFLGGYQFWNGSHCPFWSNVDGKRNPRNALRPDIVEVVIIGNLGCIQGVSMDYEVPSWRTSAVLPIERNDYFPESLPVTFVFGQYNRIGKDERSLNRNQGLFCDLYTLPRSVRLDGRERSVNKGDSERYPVEPIFSFLTSAVCFLSGFVLLDKVFRKIYFDFSVDMNLAAYFALLFFSTVIIGVGVTVLFVHFGSYL
jgi:hypothetical protein